MVFLGHTHLFINCMDIWVVVVVVFVFNVPPSDKVIWRRDG